MEKDESVGGGEGDFEAMALALEATGRYRVMRRLAERAPRTPPVGAITRTALFVDVETTGLDPKTDEVIELAMAPFTYGVDGEIFRLKPPFQAFNQPSQPISPEITAITGITDAMVAGCRIDPDAVAAFAEDAHLIIAHNAAFDRRFIERICPIFAHKPWACSLSQIDWRGEGREGAKLDYLALQAGFFYDKHRAVNDCVAAIELLATPLPRSGALGLSKLLERARRPTWRIWAENSPFELKELLKARGYRWNGEGDAAPRSWYVDVDDDAKDEEIRYLQKEIFGDPRDLMMRRITALDRFSVRC